MERRRHRTAEGSVTQSPLPYETQSRFLASSFITRVIFHGETANL